MTDNNLLQADVPRGATIIPQTRGTAPGLDLRGRPEGRLRRARRALRDERDVRARRFCPTWWRASARAGETSVIRAGCCAPGGRASRPSPSRSAERFDALEGAGRVTIAFLASGIEGIKVRLTARGDDDEAADGAARATRSDRCARSSKRRLGDIIFGVDDAVDGGRRRGQLLARGLTLAVAESVTGGLIASRLVNVPGASAWFRGGSS